MLFFHRYPAWIAFFEHLRDHFTGLIHRDGHPSHNGGALPSWLADASTIDRNLRHRVFRLHPSSWWRSVLSALRRVILYRLTSRCGLHFALQFVTPATFAAAALIIEVPTSGETSPRLIAAITDSACMVCQRRMKAHRRLCCFWCRVTAVGPQFQAGRVAFLDACQYGLQCGLAHFQRARRIFAPCRVCRRDCRTDPASAGSDGLPVLT